MSLMGKKPDSIGVKRGKAGKKVKPYGGFFDVLFSPIMHRALEGK